MTLSKVVQLLNVHWFPAMIDCPATAFTFNFLDFFYNLQDQNKCNPYNFYHTIIQGSNPAGLDLQIVLFLSTLSVVLSLTYPPASLQWNNACPLPLELPPPPQVRCCRILLSHRWVTAKWKHGNLLSCMSSTGEEYCHSPQVWVVWMICSLCLLLYWPICCKLEKYVVLGCWRLLQTETQRPWIRQPWSWHQISLYGKWSFISNIPECECR